MNSKCMLIASLLVSGCSFRTMHIEQSNLAVVTTKSVANYNLRDAGWTWDKPYITDELLKITLSSDRDLVQYSLDSKQTVDVYAFFCGKSEEDYVLNVDLYAGGKNLAYWQQVHAKNATLPDSLKVASNNGVSFLYETLIISRFLHTEEVPNFASKPDTVEYYGKYDLSTAPADLCIKLTAYAGGFSSEESNVLVVKKEEIKKAFENYKH